MNQQLELLPIDWGRMTAQRIAVLAIMSDNGWHTLAELSSRTGFPQASVSARIRDLRKPSHGARTVTRRRSFPGSGTWLYRLEP